MILPGRRTLIFGALAASLVAAGWVSLQDPQPPTRGKSAAARAAPAAAQALTGDLRLPSRRAESGTIIDPFAAVPAETESSSHAGRAKEKPAPPPLPFVFLGRYVEGDRAWIFLGEGEYLHMVRVGDIIDEKYRVDRIDNAVRITYLPLNEAQILPIGDME
jgi:hypothetical protein